jgi:competence ComEA-like helix-hairpin-helix protein
MWGRELRAGLAFVLVSLIAGAGIRGWRRDHEVRFQELVEALVEQDHAREEAAAARGGDGPAGDAGPAETGADRGAAGTPAVAAATRRQARVDPLRPGALDVDRAAAAEWVRLPGIGPSLAARIVADRDARGPFAAPEGLLRVRGIGRKTLEKIRPFLRGDPAGGATPDSIRPGVPPAKPRR